MSTYINLTDGTDSPTSVGGQLVAKAADFKAQAQGILSEIQEKEAGAPWGNDPTGHQFLEQYEKEIDTGGGKAGFASALREKLANAGDELDKIGTATLSAMTEYESTDTTNARDISKV
jgi:hypothetical protein